MKLLTFHLDQLASIGDYGGMVAAVAAHFRVPEPQALELDVLDADCWTWNSVILYRGGCRMAYDRSGECWIKKTSPAFNSAVISELSGP